MRKVTREEILDYVTYEEQRATFRAQAMAVKAPRRIHVGEYLTLLFENHDTVRYQILEMVRAEHIVKEADILHELETYNELLGNRGELGCTLMIEVLDEQRRDERLRAWLTLPTHLYARLEDGSKVRASYDPRQVGEDRVSSVQFLKFDTGGRTPITLGSDHPELPCEALLSTDQRAALEADLLEN